MGTATVDAEDARAAGPTGAEVRETVQDLAAPAQPRPNRLVALAVAVRGGRLVVARRPCGQVRQLEGVRLLFRVPSLGRCPCPKIAGVPIGQCGLLARPNWTMQDWTLRSY